jgi:hypothetical protein
MGTWYNSLSKDANKAARQLAGNWARFESFHWSTKNDLSHPEQYAIVYLSNRDSDALDRANEEAIHKALRRFIADVEDGGSCWTESHNHWAVGHVDGIVIRCVDANGNATGAFRELHRLAMDLQAYPVLDENRFSEIEQEDADLTWKNCYSDKNRLEYIRQHRDDFEFRSFVDMLGCVRGKYFAGSASKLLG